MNHTLIFNEGIGTPKKLNTLVKLPVVNDTNLGNFGNFFWQEKPTHIEVDYKNSEISQGVLYSRGYYDCCGLVLLGNEWGALSHMDIDGAIPTECDSPEKYVNEMIDSLLEKSSLDSIVAIPIGGLKDHFMQITDILKRRDVRVGNYFLDNYAARERLPEQQRKLVCSERAIMVDPAKELVVVQANFSGYGTNLVNLYGGLQK